MNTGLRIIRDIQTVQRSMMSERGFEMSIQQLDVEIGEVADRYEISQEEIDKDS